MWDWKRLALSLSALTLTRGGRTGWHTEVGMPIMASSASMWHTPTRRFGATIINLSYTCLWCGGSETLRSKTKQIDEIKRRGNSVMSLREHGVHLCFSGIILFFRSENRSGWISRRACSFHWLLVPFLSPSCQVEPPPLEKRPPRRFGRDDRKVRGLSRIWTFPKHSSACYLTRGWGPGGPHLVLPGCSSFMGETMHTTREHVFLCIRACRSK